jgi:hypothetical protein
MSERVIEDGLGRTEQITLRERLLLRQQNPGPVGLSEAGIGPAPTFEARNHVEHCETLHVIRMVQGKTGRDASSAIVADQRKGRKAKFDHYVNQFFCHCAL